MRTSEYQIFRGSVQAEPPELRSVGEAGGGPAEQTSCAV